jgi:hypothetical protein
VKKCVYIENERYINESFGKDTKMYFVYAYDYSFLDDAHHQVRHHPGQNIAIIIYSSFALPDTTHPPPSFPHYMYATPRTPQREFRSHIILSNISCGKHVYVGL